MQADGRMRAGDVHAGRLPGELLDVGDGHGPGRPGEFVGGPATRLLDRLRLCAGAGWDGAGRLDGQGSAGPLDHAQIALLAAAELVAQAQPRRITGTPLGDHRNPAGQAIAEAQSACRAVNLEHTVSRAVRAQVRGRCPRVLSAVPLGEGELDRHRLIQQ